MSKHSIFLFEDPGLIRERVVEAVRDAIIAGRLKPGERIRERELVVSLGVSRSPLQEAIRVLEAEGLVTTAAHRGAWVSELSVDDLRETTEVRVMVETYAARLTGRDLQDSTLKAMADHIKLAEETGRRGKVTTDLTYSMGFHDVFVEACGNAKLVQLYHIVKRHPRRYQLLSFARLGRAGRAVREHREILDAFLRRDLSEVERLLTAHLTRASEEIAAHLPSLTAAPPRPRR